MRYFAYGSNMDPEQMRVRCPGALPIGAARLDGYRLAFTYDAPSWDDAGVATVIADPERQVWGVLWEITDAHGATLDEYEGVAGGIYRREDATVRTLDGELVPAFLYVTIDTAELAPSPRYIAALVRGARHFGLPAGYITALEAVPVVASS